MQMSRRWCLSVASLFSLLLLAIMLVPKAAEAQTFRGTILGTVSDASGAMIGGANVTVRNVNTGLERTTQTSPDGSYRVPELPIGTYQVTISMPNFQTSVTTDVVIDVAAERRVDTALKPGAVSQTIEVSGETLPQVETTSNVLGGVMTPSQITSLPVNGRDYTKLIFMNPGVAGSPDQITDSPGSFGVFSMNGARGRSNNFLLDGTDMNDGYRNDPAINEAGVFGDPATILPIEAVAELNVLSNYMPEYGRNAGAIVNIVTRSGTNQLHGSALEYFRNNALDARNFFNTKGIPQNPFHNNQFGGSLGGPVVRDKTFFFGDYEGQREYGGQTSTACVPSPALLAGATNSVIKALIARNPWPAPNLNQPVTLAGCPNQPNLSATTRFKSTVDSVIAKVDHNFTKSHLLTGRYYFGDSIQSFPLALTGGGQLPGFNTVVPTRVQLVSISHVWVVSPTKLNEARVGWNRFAEGFFPEDQRFDPKSIGIMNGVTNPLDFGLPKITVTGFGNIGADKGDPRHRVDSNWHFIDNFSWKFGSHDVKLGYEFRRTTVSQILDRNFRGIIAFNSLTDFLSGTVDGGSQATGNTNRNSFENSHALYVQDSFQLTRRFTLNYGLRWDYYGVVGEKHDVLFNLDSTNALVRVGSPTLPRLYEPDHKNFGPRLSLAYDLTGKGKTIIRAGYGVFYDAFSQDFFIGHAPFGSTFDPGSAYSGMGPVPISFGSAIKTQPLGSAPIYATPFTPMGDAFAVFRHIRTPYMQNFNLNIQQEITSRVVLQVGYVGSNGHRLFHFLDINQPSHAQITSADTLCLCINSAVNTTAVSRTSFPKFFYLYQEQSSSSSNYNSLQAMLRLRNWHGLESQVNFVWSHSIDDSSDGEDFVPNQGTPNDSTRPNLERGNSSFDVPKRFTWNFGYQFPDRKASWSKLTDGWGIDGALTLQSGQPFTLTFNAEGDYDGSGETDGRPDVVGPIKYNRGDPNNFLDLTSFAVPCTLNGAGGTSDQNCVPGSRHFGSLPRNALRADDYRNFDLAIFKNTSLTERFVMQLRVEFFNLPNRPNFTNPIMPAFIADAVGTAGIDGAKVVNGSPNPNFGHMLGHYALASTADVGIGNPFLGGGAPRGIQLAVKFSF